MAADELRARGQLGTEGDSGRTGTQIDVRRTPLRGADQQPFGLSHSVYVAAQIVGHSVGVDAAVDGELELESQ